MNCYSIIIPVFDSNESLSNLAHRINRVFNDLPNAGYEIIFVDDASANVKTWPTLVKLRKEFNNVRIIRLTRNYGQQAATLCGIAMAKGDFFITMDDDLQHLPEDIPRLIAQQGHDVVIAQFAKKKHRMLTRLTSRIKGWFDYKLIGKPRHIALSPFRLFNRTVRDGMLDIVTPFPFLPALMFSVTTDVVGVPATHGRSIDGKSSYTFSKRLKLFSNLLINNSSFLLKSIGMMGINLAILSLVLSIYFVTKKIFYGISVIGWTSIMVVILFIGGLLLFAVGVIGEYLIRIIGLVEKRPAYCIRQTEGFDHE